MHHRHRTAVLGIARAAGAFVVEDDFARRLAHADSPPLPLPLAADDPDGIVVHVRSLTKAASPSLRIGPLSARGPVERLRAIQVVDSLFVPRPLQETALELVGSPAWTSHLRAHASALRDRRTTLLTALSGALPTLLPHQPPPFRTSHHAVDTICGCGCPTVPTSTPSPRPPCAAAWRSPPAAPTYFVQINLAPGLAGVPLGPLVAERTAIPTYIESLHRKLEAVLDRWDSYDAVRQDRITRTVRYVVDTDDEEHDLRSPIGFVDDGEQVDDLLKAIAPDLLS